MLYEIRLESETGGLIFKRYFENTLELDKENEAKVLLESLSNIIENELINKTNKRYGTFQREITKKNTSYNLTLRDENRIFVIIEIDTTKYPNNIKYNLDVRQSLPKIIKQFKSI